MTKDLTIGDCLAIAEKVRSVGSGIIGLWPMLHLVVWVDEKAGLDESELLDEVDRRMVYLSDERGSSGDRTMNALGFGALVRLPKNDVLDLLVQIKAEVLAARRLG